ncbi:large ribosomal subunit protein bL34m isoform X2 [Poecilia latipinna]|uniref:large ribosomal subunit protein bL34m isoform X2 n=1 Tax=Poecilia formosa TaxID=48698 RepID=UPI00044452E6|nr:PREDICTED: 39S ribosomal protein L34, mitochondrial isoform X2 [Poecilia formosa]XP_014829282.1 PREDICTED: 39S ribosomal protein L34, mitochondrial isoform X2 [Poecilia mexicana]XP_014916336.1 PREDICTED: 39S ribosomal protein L34, mitochondrial isoform X2 [Poecilia latipinna]
MNTVLTSISRLRGLTHLRSIPMPDLSANATSHLRFFSSWFASGAAARARVFRLLGPLSMQAESSDAVQQLPWLHQQVRTRKRGTEYQPSNIKRINTHGWIKRMSSRGGIEVILRRMLKRRKSLSH